MNFNILLSLLIVAGTAALALLQGNRLTDLKEEHVVLKEEATALGVPLNDGPSTKSDAGAKGSGAKATRGGGSPSGTRLGASTPEQEGKEFAKELIAFAQKMKEMEKTGNEPTREDKTALFSFLNRFLALDAEVIPFLMEEIRGYDGLEADDKRNILMFAMMSMSQSAPEKALDLFINSGELFTDGRRPDEMVGMALGGWAGKDPKAALAWLDLHGDSLRESTVKGARAFAVANAFTSDPDFAVALALTMDREDIMKLSQQVGGLMQSPQDQLELLRSVQDKLGPLPDDPSQINDELIATATEDQVLHGGLLVGLGGLLTRDSFESGRQFLDSADLSPTETFIVAKGIADRAGEIQDPGPWLPWIHANSPPNQQDETISGVVQNWTRRDFRATASWIGEQAPGPLRETATYSFAEAVAPHEPASAAEWALTLPASPERTELLQGIHTQWSPKDAAAAAAFAQQHGLQE